MAKKRKTKKNGLGEEMLSNMLPQNIVAFGEKVVEDKNIYISQKVYKEIHKFTKDKTTNESGGILVGTVIEEFDKKNIIINNFIEAKYCEATPTTLTFTHKSWEYIHKEMEKKYPNQKIVGWIHTHPNFGIFLSEYDKFIQNNFFNEEHQIAYVIDPIQTTEGFYFWINGKIEHCNGFYVFDKTGVKISIVNEEEKKESEIKQSNNPIVGILAIALIILVVIQAFININLSNGIKNLEEYQKQSKQNFIIINDYIKKLRQQTKTENRKESSDAEEQDVSENYRVDINNQE